MDRRQLALPADDGQRLFQRAGKISRRRERAGEGVVGC
jgi:hypothetical protein